MKSWKVEPQLIHGEDFQDCLILVFGNPRTAIYAHMDSVGYTVGYSNQLLKIGGPKAEEGTVLIGSDSQGEVKGKLHYSVEDESLENKVIKTVLQTDRVIDPGTPLCYQAKFIEEVEYLESNYLDNRLGMWNALEVAKTLTDGAIVFSAWEEVGGGSVGYCASYLFEKFKIRQSLISDITWVTDGVRHGKGVAISNRDSGIPRRSYIEKIVSLAKTSGIDYQIEVESAGGSDGNALQKSPYPIDWCFIGAAEDNVHQPNERVHKKDVSSMVELYTYLMKKL
jgi:putative aminopeptidase FrvX